MDFNKLKVSVIGCGWLGLPLCESLIQHGCQVITTTTDHEKLNLLRSKLNIQLLDITDTPVAIQVDPDLLKCDVLIYTVPPLGLGEVERFFASVAHDQKIIFISSTSVYGKNQGAVTEESSFDPNSENALVLREAEKYLKNRFRQLSIIRPGGLYGEKRHPVYFLAGRKGITSGEEYLHLVHRDDCVRAILKIIGADFIGENFNLVSDLRILKKDYYTEIAKKLGLVPPQFTVAPLSNPTNITNDKSKKLLSLTYLDPSSYL